MNTMLITSLAVFMVSLDMTILFVAFPAIEAAFPALPASQLAWVLNIYTILFGSFLIPAGVYADQWGRKKFFSAGICIFTIASLLSGMSANIPTLIMSRALQAIGAALLVPSSLALLLTAIPAQRRAVAISIWGATGALAAAFGPSLGAFIVQTLGWRFVFFVNIPVGLITLFLSLRRIQESSHPQEFIPNVFASLALAASLILLSLATMNHGSHPGHVAYLYATGSVSAFLLFLIINQHSKSPAIDFTIFAVQTTFWANIGTLLFSIAFTSMFFGSVLFLSKIWHYSTVGTGLAMTPGPLIVIPSAILGGRYAAKKGHSYLIVLGGIFFALGVLQRILWPMDDPDFLFGWLPGVVAIGIGIGLMMASFSAAATYHLPKQRYAMGSGINNTIRQIGSAIGVILVVLTAHHQAGFRFMFIVSSLLGLFAGILGFKINTAPQSLPISYRELAESSDEEA